MAIVRPQVRQVVPTLVGTTHIRFAALRFATQSIGIQDILASNVTLTPNGVLGDSALYEMPKFPQGKNILIKYDYSIWANIINGLNNLTVCWRLYLQQWTAPNGLSYDGVVSFNDFVAKNNEMRLQKSTLQKISFDELNMQYSLAPADLQTVAGTFTVAGGAVHSVEAWLQVSVESQT